MKQCPKCKKQKSKSEFGRNRSRPDGLSFWCQKCSREYGKQYYKKDKKHIRQYRRYEEARKVADGILKKRCPKCKKWKDKSEFNSNYQRLDGLTDYCKICDRKRVRKYYRRHGQPVKKHYTYDESHRVIRGVRQKRCRKCRTWKPESKFYKHRRNKDGLDVWCIECNNKAQRMRRKARRKRKKTAKK